jgi:hypothetical protein
VLSSWAGLLLAGLVRGGCGVGFEPGVEGEGEGEELLFAVERVDLFDVEFGAFEGGVVEAADVVKEVAGEGGVGVDDGALEAEVVFVLGDLLVDGRVVDGEGDDGELGAHRVFGGEEAAVDLFVGGGGDLVVVDGDELHAGVVEGEGAVAVVGDDDADGEEAVLDVFEAEEAAGPGVVAGLGGEGDVLGGVGVEDGVLGGGFGGGRGLVVGGAGGEGQAEECGGEAAEGPR